MLTKGPQRALDVAPSRRDRLDHLFLRAREQNPVVAAPNHTLSHRAGDGLVALPANLVVADIDAAYPVAGRQQLVQPSARVRTEVVVLEADTPQLRAEAVHTQRVKETPALGVAQIGVFELQHLQKVKVLQRHEKNPHKDAEVVVRQVEHAQVPEHGEAPQGLHGDAVVGEIQHGHGIMLEQRAAQDRQELADVVVGEVQHVQVGVLRHRLGQPRDGLAVQDVVALQVQPLDGARVAQRLQNVDNLAV